MNRTLVEMARCSLLEAKLPSKFWAEAIATAAHIRNRCPTRSLSNRIPYEARFGKKPDVSHFKHLIVGPMCSINVQVEKNLMKRVTSLSSMGFESKEDCCKWRYLIFGNGTSSRRTSHTTSHLSHNF